MGLEGLEALVTECFHAKASVFHLILGMGRGDTKGIWWMMDLLYGTGLEQISNEDLTAEDME